MKIEFGAYLEGEGVLAGDGVGEEVEAVVLV